MVVGPVADGIMPTVIEDYLDDYPDMKSALKRENLTLLTQKLIFRKREARQICFHTIDAVKKYLKLVEIYEQ